MEVNNFDTDILNRSLALALEWGENWLQPIQDRLISEYPKLSSTQADFLNSVCEKTMVYANMVIHKILSEERIEVDILKENFLFYIKEKHYWIDESNLTKLFSQGCYFAWKDGLI